MEYILIVFITFYPLGHTGWGAITSEKIVFSSMESCLEAKKILTAKPRVSKHISTRGICIPRSKIIEEKP